MFLILLRNCHSHLFQYFVVEYGMYNDEPPDMFNKDWNGNVTSGISKGMHKRIKCHISTSVEFMIIADVLQGCTPLTN